MSFKRQIAFKGINGAIPSGEMATGRKEWVRKHTLRLMNVTHLRLARKYFRLSQMGAIPPASQSFS